MVPKRARCLEGAASTPQAVPAARNVSAGHDVIMNAPKASEHASRSRDDPSKTDTVCAIVGELDAALCRPLAALRGDLERLFENTPASRKAREQVETMTLMCDDLMGLTRDFLDYTELLCGGVVPRWSSCAAKSLLAGLDRRFRAEAAARKLDWFCRLDGADLKVTTDVDRWHQALGHLVRNALVYTPIGGSIRVVGRIEGSSWSVTVSDTGPGIPETLLPRAFEPLRGHGLRWPSGRSRRRPGPGLVPGAGRAARRPARPRARLRRRSPGPGPPADAAGAGLRVCTKIVFFHVAAAVPAAPDSGFRIPYSGFHIPDPAESGIEHPEFGIRNPERPGRPPLQRRSLLILKHPFSASARARCRAGPECLRRGGCARPGCRGDGARCRWRWTDRRRDVRTWS